MTIKKKLFTLVFGELLMFLIVIGVVAVSILPILKINDEFSQLSKLKEQILSVDVQVNLMISSPIALQWEKSVIEKEKLDKQFKIVSQQESLSGINAKVEQSLKAVLLLEELFTQRWKSLEKQVPEIISDAERVMFASSVPLVNFYKVTNRSRYSDYDEILQRVGDFEQKIGIVEGALGSAYDVVSTQDEVIQREISRKIRSLIIRTLIIFAAVIMVTVIASVKIASGMADSIVSLEKGVSRLRKGRLTADFKTTSKDEIGKLGENLNGFTDGLSSSILKIKESSSNTLLMKEELVGAVEDTKSSASGISDGVETIRDGMIDLNGRVAESGVAVNTVKSRTDELSGMLEEQMAMIEESTSSVTEMIASISNVSEITGKKKVATNELVKTAGTGGERLNETINIIQEITANVDEIRGTASIIQSVAAQTSLLAMNAAIEAAHAGEYGAGFSVVAEEIRKLADASGSSSKRISGVIKEVVGSIEKAAASGDGTRRAFVDINTEVVEVAGALDEISSSMDELSAGGRQILDAMASLRGYASNVKDGGNAMADASVSLEDAFKIVERVTSGVLTQVGGIGSRIEEISSAVNVVADINSRLSSESELLEAEVSQYDLGNTEERLDEAIPEEELPDEANVGELLSAAPVDESAD